MLLEFEIILWVFCKSLVRFIKVPFFSAKVLIGIHNFKFGLLNTSWFKCDPK